MNEVMIALGSLILGAVLSTATEEMRRRQARRDQRADSLRSQRAEAYQTYMETCHETAHLLGRAARDSGAPIEDPKERTAVRMRTDSHVSKYLMRMQIFAEAATFDAAKEMRARLRDMRKLVEDDVSYTSKEFYDAIGAYQKEREKFILLARQEVLVGVPH